MEVAGFGVRLNLGQEPFAFAFAFTHENAEGSDASSSPSLTVRPLSQEQEQPPLPSPTTYAAPVLQARYDPCLLLSGAGQLEVPFPRPVRLSGGQATLELLVRVDKLPGKGQRAFLMGCSGGWVYMCGWMLEEAGLWCKDE